KTGFQAVIAKAKPVVLFGILLAMVNSVFYMAVLVLINQAASGQMIPTMQIPNWAIFVIVISVSFLVSTYFQTYLVKVTHNIIYDFEMEFMDVVRNCDYENMRRIGKNKVISAVQDTRLLGETPEMIINVLNALIVVG